MSKVIAAVPRNDALVKRAVNNLKECNETLEAHPQMIHNGCMIDEYYTVSVYRRKMLE